MKILCIIGIGGVGSEIARKMIQYCNYKEIYNRIYLIDGDKVEPKNLERQQFDKNDFTLNKAQAIADSIESKTNVIVVPEYVNSKKLREIIPDSYEIHFVAAVDNNKTKKEINDWFNGLPNAVGFMAGNEYSDGTVAMAIRQNNKPITPDLSYLQDQIITPTDKSPDEIGCAEEIQSSPQLLWANNGAAFWTCCALYALNEGTLKPFRMLYFDVKHLMWAKSEFPADAMERLEMV